MTFSTRLIIFPRLSIQRMAGVVLWQLQYSFLAGKLMLVKVTAEHDIWVVALDWRVGLKLGSQQDRGVARPVLG